MGRCGWIRAACGAVVAIMKEAAELKFRLEFYKRIETLRGESVDMYWLINDDDAVVGLSVPAGRSDIAHYIDNLLKNSRKKH